MSLPPSELGTKSHWDSVYSLEVANLDEFSDEGEVWFGEEAEEKIIEWIEEHVAPVSPGSPTAIRVLDVGTGNGHLLCRVAEEFAHLVPDKMMLTGVDYSESAVQLARQVAAKHGLESRVDFFALDFLRDPVPYQGEWDLLLDKGTLDAISLCPDLVDGQPADHVYVRQAAKALGPHGILLVTSCNWTEEELIEKFAPVGLVVHSTVRMPVIEFGGHVGSTTAVVAFHRAA
ncbi:methyltransferase [Schizosaccharomyces japonicus yFS275]|uniref:Protein-lysine N-methyltransferase EFM4 n=1 Tax=Schizosaccharomyces japonicus (strain yFS275 / FY16936) TaxID=402676 RepID=B6K630_SCHJY|nr:methyltransferase [Schizosaccharomyces japonicus yFS275]EEB08984.1 methyltransferase [Schizosaccharomyces japonicus yFS275]